MAGCAAASTAVVGIVIAHAAAGDTGDTAAAKQQYQALLQQGYSQDQAAIPAPKAAAGVLPSFAPCSPEALPSAGIDNSPVQVGPDSYEAFVTSNQWTGPVATAASPAYVVWAGVTGENASPPGIPAVVVDVRTLSPDGCTVTTAEVGTFTEPVATGPLSITSVQGTWVYLQTPNGVPFYFNLATDQFTSSAPST
jgi:hypothetical protein